MQPTIERAVLRCALRRRVEPGTILATLCVDMPQSNGKLHLAITRNHRFNQLTAVILPRQVAWLHQKVNLPQGNIVIPDFVFYFIRANVRSIGISHLVGIIPVSKLPTGTPLVETVRPRYIN